jgi:thioredoxin reductase
VFGSERRVIELPTVRSDFQSDVPGIYVAGELGGMGLLANAVEQGAQAAKNLALALPPCPEGGVDVVIVGAGPAGLSAGMWCQKNGVSYALLEQGEFGGAIRHYPRQKLVMTRPLSLPGYKKLNFKEATKEQLIEILEDAVRTTGLRVDCSERVLEVTKTPSGGFVVKTTRRTVLASKVLLAVGRRGTPRRLEKPGEEQAKVAYRLLDAERYQHNHILVVGGGDSAVEAACSLAQQPGNRVTLSYRRANLSRPKAANRERALLLAERGELSLALGSEVVSIEEDRVFLTQDGEEQVLPNDFVFVLVGGVLPSAFLRSVGISLETHYGLRIEESPSVGPS